MLHSFDMGFVLRAMPFLNMSSKVGHVCSVTGGSSTLLHPQAARRRRWGSRWGLGAQGLQDTAASGPARQEAEGCDRQTDKLCMHYSKMCALQRTGKFCKELRKCIPNTELYYRRGLDLKKITPQAISRGFTDLLVINEDQKKPSIFFCFMLSVIQSYCALNKFVV